MKLTDEQIRGLCDKARPGPWEQAHEPGGVGVVGTTKGAIAIIPISTGAGTGQLIAAARELVPLLLDRAQKAEALLLQSVGDAECKEMLNKTAQELGGDWLRVDSELKTMQTFADLAIASGDLGGGTIILNAAATIRRLSEEMRSDLPS